MTQIVLTPEIFTYLEATRAGVHGKEFSGLGFLTREGSDFHVYDVEVLHVGSEVFTEIQAEEMFKLSERQDRNNLRLWFHRHPIGNDVPGEHNWSGTDRQTILEGPLGGIPELIGWSVSIVRTPIAWIGRIDNHIKKTVLHVPVVPQVGLKLLEEKWVRLYSKNLARYNLVPEKTWAGKSRQEAKQEEYSSYQGTMGRCYQCENQEPLIECVYCGSPVCKFCRNNIKGEIICQECQPELLKGQKQTKKTKRIKLW